MSNEIASKNLLIDALDKAAQDGMLAQKESSQFKKMFAISGAIAELKNLLTPVVMKQVMELQNTSLGFKTDNKAGYSLDIVKNCLIEATLKGVYPVGNEFNIIASQCYITKEGFYHKLRDIPNFTWVETPNIPKMAGEKGAIISIELEWINNKKEFNKTLELAIRVNSMMGTDAIIGKAIRKARAWLYTTVTGQDVGDGDVDDGIIETTAKEVISNKSVFEQPINNSEAVQDNLKM